MSVNKNFRKIFLRKSTEVFKYMEDGMYSSILAKKVDMTYAHVIKIIYKLEAAELVGRIKKGRMMVINLTEKGEKVRDEMLKLMRELDKVEARKKDEES